MHVYTFRFPNGADCHKVLRQDFYAISAAYGDMDLDKERKGAAPSIVPVYIGGSVMRTVLIDLR